jgi:hypothetical protein
VDTVQPNAGVPLVVSIRDGFVLSQEFMHAVGPFWGRSWEVKAFVAHIISHFDDPLEHLLDNCPGGDEELFDVDPEWCEIMARKYRKEFLDLPPEWYRSLYRAKLVSLRIPGDLIADAKLAYFRKHHNFGLVIRGLVNLLRSQSPHVSDMLLQRVTSLDILPEVEGWFGFEQVLTDLLDSEIITTDDIGLLLIDPEVWDE